MDVSLESKIAVPEHVLVQKIENEAAILNLESETYFGLDDVGSEMWKALQSTATIGEASRVLHEKYEVAPEQLENDLLNLVTQLAENGLVQVD